MSFPCSPSCSLPRNTFCWFGAANKHRPNQSNGFFQHSLANNLNLTRKICGWREGGSFEVWVDCAWLSFLTRCRVVVKTHCSKQQEEVLLSRAGESHVCNHPRWLSRHCALQADFSRVLKPWHKEDGCRTMCICAVGACKPPVSAGCIIWFSVKWRGFRGPGWTVCPRQHWLGCGLHTAESQSKGALLTQTSTHLRQDLSVSAACGKHLRPCRTSWLALCRVQDVFSVPFTAVATSICSPKHVKSRTLPYMQGNSSSWWQNELWHWDLVVQTLS